MISCLMIAACSTTRHLPEGENLYVGASVKINPDSSGKIKDEKGIKSVLEGKTRPLPNSSFLGFKYKLFFYNLGGEPGKEKGLGRWFRNKWGQPPVLGSQVKLKYNNDVLRSYLSTIGYLQAEVTGDTVVKNKKVKAIYTAQTGERYKINKVTFPKDSSGIAANINNNSSKSLLKAGNFYDFETIKNERIRIDNDLKEAGYFYFSPDFLLIQADSTIGKNSVNLFVKVKESTPDVSKKPYTINNITIYPNYNLTHDSAIKATEPVLYKDFKIMDPKNTFKLGVFDRLVFFNKGETYNRRDHNQSLNRMVNIGTFKFVKADFIPVDSFKNNQLNIDFFLTPLKKNSLSFQVTGTSKSNNFVGSEVKITQTTRNVFRGAEQLEVSASGGFEKQIKGGQSKQGNSYSLTGQAKLSFPRFLLPFFKFNSTNAFIPRTNILASYQILSRADYSLNAIKGEFGYNWKESIFKEHTFNPISINYVKANVKNDSLFIKSPALRNTLEDQYIIGLNYNFTYNDQIDDSRRNNVYFSADLETAGTVAGLLTSKNDLGKKTLFGTALSQFIRLEGDLRNYYKLNKNMTWANRLNVGYGYTYGNSTTLPFVRQFFAGGSSDIRAFGARILGPGSFNPENNLSTFRDQGADIKIMLNTELRFKIVSIFYGALFVDAGNIWTRKEDLNRAGAQFKFNSFMNEMAVGTGAGLRIDVSFFVLRLDAAFPIRKPYLPEGKRWVINDLNFGDKAWRKENLTFNLGIGYPF
jgi:outer membrane protein insertion porin family